MPCPTSALLITSNLACFNRARQLIPRRELTHKLGVGVALRPAKLMVQVNNVRTAARFHEHVKEYDGIRPARYADEKRLARLEHLRQSSLSFREHGLYGVDIPQPAHVWRQNLGDFHAAVGLLMGLQQRHVQARERRAAAVEDVYEPILAVGALKLDIGAARLEILTVRAAGYFEIRVLARRPHFDVVRLGAGEPHIARAQEDDAVM